MKRFIICCLASCVFALGAPVEVFAFGGGGHDRVRTRYKQGVDAIGFHISEDGQADVDFSCSDEQNQYGICQNDAPRLVENSEDDAMDLCSEVYPGAKVNGVGGYVGMVENLRCYCEQTDFFYDKEQHLCQQKNKEFCTSFMDCNKGYYCQFSPTDCTSPNTGVCKSLQNDFFGLFFYTASNGVTYGFGTDLKGNLDWWTANDVCSTYGLTMVSLDDLNCSFQDIYKLCSDPNKLYKELGQNFSLGAGVYTTTLVDSCRSVGVIIETDSSAGYVGFQNRNDYKNRNAAVLCQETPTQNP